MFSPDGSRLLGADDSGALKIWDPATGREIAATTLAGCLYINTIRYSRDGALVAVVGHRVPVMTGEVRILDAGRACVLAAVERLPLARVGPTTPTRASRLADASVDPTEARNAPARDQR